VEGLVQRCLKRVGRWAAGPIAVLAGLGAHVTALIVLGALVLALAVLACLMWRWTLASTARSNRGVRVILALRGDSRSLPQRPAAKPAPRLAASRAEATAAGSPRAVPTVKATLTSRVTPSTRRRKG
jgi:hypothetical protein